MNKRRERETDKRVRKHKRGLERGTTEAFRQKDFGGLGRTRGDHETSVFFHPSRDCKLVSGHASSYSKVCRPIFKPAPLDNTATPQVHAIDFQMYYYQRG